MLKQNDFDGFSALVKVRLWIWISRVRIPSATLEPKFRRILDFRIPLRIGGCRPRSLRKILPVMFSPAEAMAEYREGERRRRTPSCTRRNEIGRRSNAYGDS
jgi:hypothetical protein